MRKPLAPAAFIARKTEIARRLTDASPPAPPGFHPVGLGVVPGTRWLGAAPRSFHHDRRPKEALRDCASGADSRRDAARPSEVINAWGFAYKTVAFTWAKLNRSSAGPTFSEPAFFTGMGYWTRANAEQCLLATIGKPRRLSKAVRQLIVSRRREHSRKPDEAYGRIEALVSGPYLELFARNRRPGWTAWGDQIGLFECGHIAHRAHLAVLAWVLAKVHGQSPRALLAILSVHSNTRSRASDDEDCAETHPKDLAHS